jgi:hypothetical protein
MAQITQAEFNEAVAALAEHFGIERLRDHLARMNAFTSRRGLNSATAIAERLHLLTGCLRRQVPGTYAFSSLWGDMIAKRVGEDGEKRLEKLADEVNACLAPDDSVAAGKEGDLDEALGRYRQVMEELTGTVVARLDMLLKAVPAVAERVRRSADAPAAVPPNAG